MEGAQPLFRTKSIENRPNLPLFICEMHFLKSCVLNVEYSSLLIIIHGLYSLNLSYCYVELDQSLIRVDEVLLFQLIFGVFGLFEQRPIEFLVRILILLSREVEFLENERIVFAIFFFLEYC